MGQLLGMYSLQSLKTPHLSPSRASYWVCTTYTHWWHPISHHLGPASGCVQLTLTDDTPYLTLAGQLLGVYNLDSLTTPHISPSRASYWVCTTYTHWRHPISHHCGPAIGCVQLTLTDDPHISPSQASYWVCKAYTHWRHPISHHRGPAIGCVQLTLTDDTPYLTIAGQLLGVYTLHSLTTPHISPSRACCWVCTTYTHWRNPYHHRGPAVGCILLGSWKLLPTML